MGRFRSRLRTSLQGATALGIAMILLTWGTIAFQLHVNQRTAIQGASQESANLARAFEEQIVAHHPRHRFHPARPARDLCEEYRQLRFAGMDLARRHRDRRRPSIFDHRSATDSCAPPRSEPSQPMNLSDRDHFKAHVESHDRRGLHQQAADRTKLRQGLDPAQPPHPASRRHLRRRDRGVGRSRAARALLSIDQYRARRRHQRDRPRRLRARIARLQERGHGFQEYGRRSRAHRRGAGRLVRRAAASSTA